jgi:hypothetical protein
MVHVMRFPMIKALYFYISTFRSTCAAPTMDIFCSSLLSCFPGILVRYFLNGFEMVTVAPRCYWYDFRFYIPHTLYFYCFIIIIIDRFSPDSNGYTFFYANALRLLNVCTSHDRRRQPAAPLGAFAKLRKASTCLSVRQSVCPHETTRLPLHRFS